MAAASRSNRRHGFNISESVLPPRMRSKTRPIGRGVSELFPHVAGCVDDLAIIRSVVSNFSEHTNANYFLHTGSGLQGRPSMGAWVTYGLGWSARISPGSSCSTSGLIPPGGMDCSAAASCRHLPGLCSSSRPHPLADIERSESITAVAEAANSTSCASWIRAFSAAWGTTTASRPRSAITSSPSRCRPRCPS